MTQKKQTRSRLKPHRNPYRDAQAKQRKAANLARQKVLQEQRAKAMGDPVRSTPTPFIESLTTGRMPSEPTKEEIRNFFLQPGELAQSLEYSGKLSAPYIRKTADTPKSVESAQKPAVAGTRPKEDAPSGEPPTLPIERGDTTLKPNPYTGARATTPDDDKRMARIHETAHQNAARALSLISALNNGSSADLTRYNIHRCISTFGRHNTDTHLPPRPSSVYNINPSPTKLRAGPDTGSSEVQVAILTTKINVLANNLHNKDKINKRNLRLLVHRRQKLLNYLQKKERAGPRWRNLVDGLGIQDAMWKGEISL